MMGKKPYIYESFSRPYPHRFLEGRTRWASFSTPEEFSNTSRNISLLHCLTLGEIWLRIIIHLSKYIQFTLARYSSCHNTKRRLRFKCCLKRTVTFSGERALTDGLAALMMRWLKSSAETRCVWWILLKWFVGPKVPRRFPVLQRYCSGLSWIRGGGSHLGCSVTPEPTRL